MVCARAVAVTVMLSGASAVLRRTRGATRGVRHGANTTTQVVRQGANTTTQVARHDANSTQVVGHGANTTAPASAVASAPAATVPGHPEQGFEGPNVLHKNKTTIAMDWGHEYPHIDGYVHGGIYGPHGDAHAHPYGTHPWLNTSEGVHTNSSAHVDEGKDKSGKDKSAAPRAAASCAVALVLGAVIV